MEKRSKEAKQNVHRDGDFWVYFYKLLEGPLNRLIPAVCEGYDTVGDVFHNDVLIPASAHRE